MDTQELMTKTMPPRRSEAAALQVGRVAPTVLAFDCKETRNASTRENRPNSPCEAPGGNVLHRESQRDPRENGHPDFHSSREEEDQLPTKPMRDKVANCEGNAAQSRESSGDYAQQPQQPGNLASEPPFPQEDVASSSARSSDSGDAAEPSGLRRLLASGVVNHAVLRNGVEYFTQDHCNEFGNRGGLSRGLGGQIARERARSDLLMVLLAEARELVVPELEDRYERA